MILSSVLLTLLLLRNNLISLHQSSNFIQSPSNYPGSRTMLLGIPADSFITGVIAGAVDISVFICSSLVEASLLICKDPSYSDNASISFVLLELVLASHGLYYTCFISQQITLSSIVHIHLSYKMSLSTLYQM